MRAVEMIRKCSRNNLPAWGIDRKRCLLIFYAEAEVCLKNLYSGSLEAFELRTELGISAIFTAALAMTDDCAENTKVPWPRAKFVVAL